MKRITVNASAGYDVLIGRDLLKDAGKYIKALGGAEKVLLVSDDTVSGLYGKAAEDSLRSAGFDVYTFVFPHGESSKNIRTYGQLLEKALADGLSRGDIFVSLGGGVVSDLTGFAAATYKRGVRFAVLPTTLLADVDASVGGKTGIDLDGGKNQAGAFHQPSLVLCDTELLNTLPDEQYRSGLAEVIKTAMLGDPALFEMLENAEFRPDPQKTEEMIAACVDIKRRYVTEDEFDNGSRMLLNFGHTFGHAIEAASGYEIPHGYAVAAGMAIISRSACNRGFCTDEVPARLERLLEKHALPADTHYTANELLPYVAGDKKTRGGSVNLIIPTAIGSCRIEKAGLNEIEELMYDGGIR